MRALASVKRIDNEGRGRADTGHANCTYHHKLLPPSHRQSTACCRTGRSVLVEASGQSMPQTFPPACLSPPLGVTWCRTASWGE